MLRFPRAEWGIEERDDDGYSVAIEPLVHGDSSPHAWHAYAQRSLLGQAWFEASQFRREGGRGPLPRAAAEGVQAACHWDPELAVAFVQLELAPWREGGRDPLDVDTGRVLLRMVFDPDRGPVGWYHEWNELRRMVGLPELSLEEMDALVLKGGGVSRRHSGDAE
jgi:hypothetical protein